MINFITREGTSEGIIAALICKETHSEEMFTPMFVDPLSAYSLINTSAKSGCTTYVFDVDYKKHLVTEDDARGVIAWIDNHYSSQRNPATFLVSNKNVSVMELFLKVATNEEKYNPSVATKTLAQCVISGDNEISKMLYAFVNAYGSATAFNLLSTYQDYNFLSDENAKSFIFEQEDRLEDYYDDVVGVKNMALLVGSNVDKYNDLKLVNKELLATGYNIVVVADRDRSNNWILKVNSSNHSANAFITYLLAADKVLFKGGGSSNSGSGLFHATSHYKSSRKDIEDLLKEKYIEFLAYKAAKKKAASGIKKPSEALTAPIGEIVE